MNAPAPASLTDQFIDLDGPLRVIDHGGEGPTAVLVHGLGGSSENWLALVTPLKAQHRVFTLDLPGFGLSPPGARRTEVGHYARLVARLIARLPGGRATVFGNSMGGMIAILTAAIAPAAVDAAVLLNPAVPNFSLRHLDPKVASVFALYAVPGVGEWFTARAARTTPPEEALAWFLKLCGLEPTALPPELWAQHLQVAKIRRGYPWANPSFLRATRSILRLNTWPWALLREARAVTAPVLLLHGGRDRLVPVESAREMARRLPAWRYVELAPLGHTPMLEAPETVIAHYDAWRRGLDIR